MKVSIKHLIWALSCCLVLGGCGGGGGGGTGKPSVFVSVLPQAGFVKKIAGSHVDVHVLVGEGQDPHHYALEPKQSVALGKADILFTIGMPFENTLVDTIRGGKMKIKVIDCTGGIEKIEEEHHHHEGEGHDEDDHDHDHHHHGDDPHVWTSPVLVKKVAANIAKALSDLDADNKETYEKNLAAFEEELDALHAEIETKMKPHEGSGFYVYHPAFGYFANEYGLEQVSVEIGGQTPTPKELAEFLEHAKEDGIKVLFVQPQFDTKSAKAIADELGAQVVSLDPLDEDVPANLRKIAEAIDKAFR